MKKKCIFDVSLSFLYMNTLDIYLLYTQVLYYDSFEDPERKKAKKELIS
jgi:hypothetical protein